LDDCIAEFTVELELESVGPSLEVKAFEVAERIGSLVDAEDTDPVVALEAPVACSCIGIVCSEDAMSSCVVDDRVAGRESGAGGVWVMPEIPIHNKPAPARAAMKKMIRPLLFFRFGIAWDVFAQS